MKVAIIGGGIIGLCSAYYLQKEGVDVTIIEKTDGLNGCSFGNAGYISPSHYIPLASPGIISQGLKWMLSSTSPFYIKPRMDMNLIKWGLLFWKNSTAVKVEKSIPPLNEILHYSRTKTIEIANELKNPFDLQLKGCYMMYRDEKTAHHEMELCEKSKKLGIETKTFTNKELNEAEPGLGINALGAVWYPIDAHLNPIKWMKTMKEDLLKKGVNILYNNEVKDFIIEAGIITKVITDKEDINIDKVVIASGSWLPETLKRLGLTILLQAGKGYSTTYDNVVNNLSKPAILVDDRVALTPLSNSLRIGGTMELGGINHTINIRRMNAIVDAVNKNFSELKFNYPPISKVWCGLRPVSPDGLPYIGKCKINKNLVVAGGHAMIGISLAAGTGKIVSDLLHDKKTEIDITAFDINR
jgi:D-amino-acid dehydrogenase